MSIHGPRFTVGLADRDRFFLQMRRICEQTTNHEVIEQWTAAYVKVQKTMMESYWTQYQNQQASLTIEFADDVDHINHLDMSAQVAAQVFEVTMELLGKRLEELTFVPEPVKTLAPPKPSEIVLRTFNGDYTSWSAWRSQFVSRVYDTTLPVHSKLDLLFNALTGEAKLCAGIVDGRDQADLDRVWTKLSQVYDNKYQLVGAHCDSILDLPVLAKADPAALRRMVDVFEKETDALKRFGFNIDAWSPILAVIMLRKLDHQTRSDWEMSRDVQEVQSVANVTAFLEKKVQALRNRTSATSEPKKESNGEPSSSNKRSHDGSDHHNHKDKRQKLHNAQQSKTKTEHQSDKPSCLLCKDKFHFLWHCTKFRTMDLNTRIEQVNSWKLCPCCLLKKHSSDQCSVAGCSRCDGAKHNNMLCPKHTVFRTLHLSTRRRRRRNGNSAE